MFLSRKINSHNSFGRNESFHIPRSFTNISLDGGMVFVSRTKVWTIVDLSKAKELAHCSEITRTSPNRANKIRQGEIIDRLGVLCL
jgi:hypothetical protein